LTSINDELIKIASFYGGEEAVKIVKFLSDRKEATDDVIATETNVRLNTVRKILYRLYDHGLVSSTRFRDEKTGWYTFYWKLQPDQLDAFIRSRKRRALEKLKARLEYEKSHSFFICKKCPSIRVTFEEAMESAFHCVSCGGPLTSEDNSAIVEVLSKIVEKLESELCE
jgi:transcription initiation factor TFIIE subunit alpha